MTMTAHQQSAYASPCYRSRDTLLPGLGWATLRAGRLLTLRLTVNVGLE